MVQFVYIDETGAPGTSSARQPYLRLAAVLVDEDKVAALGEALKKVVHQHVDWPGSDFEMHGYELWNGIGPWSTKTPAELIAAYESAIGLLDDLHLDVAHSTIDKPKLHARFNGAADENAYRLALQFLLEKIDRENRQNKVLVADEAKEQQLHAINMVAEMQEWGGGEVVGKQLTTVIDSLHFVRSNASPGVQMADLVAYVLQRAHSGRDKHPDAAAAIRRLNGVVRDHTVTYRMPWPPGH